MLACRMASAARSSPGFLPSPEAHHAVEAAPGARPSAACPDGGRRQFLVEAGTKDDVGGSKSAWARWSC